MPFYDHVFLDTYLKKYNLPKDGHVTKFMDLLCVGLSKNPYMGIQKKRKHLDWFAEYFIKHREKASKDDETPQIPVEIKKQAFGRARRGGLKKLST